MRRFRTGERQRPPSISAPVGLYTLNGSWMVGAGQRCLWRDDRIRYLGGGGYRIIESETTFDTPEIFPGLNVPSLDFRTAGLGLSLIFDSRNNTFTPDRGMFLKAQPGTFPA